MNESVTKNVILKCKQKQKINKNKQKQKYKKQLNRFTNLLSSDNHQRLNAI